MRLSSYYHEDYSGGLNTTSREGAIARNEASLLRNWDITNQGQLYRRDGTIQTGDTLSNEIDGLHYYKRLAGGKDLILMEGGALRYLNGSTWDALDTGFTSGTKTWYSTCPLDDRVYMSNEDDSIHYWDRASVVLNACLTDLGAAVPHGNVLLWHKNHMFTCNNVTVSGTTYPNRIYWSAIGDPTTWDTANDFIEVPGQGNVIGLADLGDSLVIFKERNLQFMTGWGDSDWRITASSSNVANLSEQVGSISPRGITRVGNEIWFIDDEAIIRRIYQTDFDPFRRDVISTKLVGTLNGMNKVQLNKVVAESWNDKVYFSIPFGSSVNNDLTLVFDIKASKRTQSEAWTTYTGWVPSVMTLYDTTTTPELYYGGVDGKIYRHKGIDDDGTAIDSRWDGKDDDFDRPERWKRYRFGYVWGLATDDINVGIYASMDDAAFADLGDLDLTPTGGTLGPTGTFELGPTGTTAILGGAGTKNFKYYFSSGGGSVVSRHAKMSIRHAVINERPIVNNFTIHYKQKVLR